jgi:hypothetical protein
LTETPPPFGYDVLPSTQPSRGRTWLPVVSVLSVLAIVAVALLLVVGRQSAGSASVTDAAALVHAASGRAARAGSSDVIINMTVKAAGHTVTATGGGSFDYRRRVGQMHIDMAGLGQMQEIVTPTAIYMRLPDSMGGALGTGTRPWLMIRFSEFKRYGIDYTKLMNNSGGSDPSSMLRVLSQASGVRRTGSATIDGVHTTKFSASGRLLDLVRAQGEGSGVDLSKLPPQMADTSVHYDVWLDKTGLPRRMTMKMSGGAFAGGAMDMTMDFLHYGAPVSVTVPPPSVVTDMGPLLKQSGG